MSLAVLVAASQPASAQGREERAARASGAAVEAVTGPVEAMPTQAPDHDSAATVATPTGTVDIPRYTHGRIRVAGGAVRIGLPRTTSRPAVRAPGGTVVYADAQAPADVAVQPTTEGVRALVVLKDETAPREYAFPVDGPEGSQLVSAAALLGPENDTGEVLLLDRRGRALGLFEPAWARDANGRSVPTSYRIEGRTLVQTVAVDGATAFPVVADPNWWDIAACAASLVWLVGSNIVIASKIIKIRSYINALGGFRKSAELMLRASTWEERMRLGGGALVGLASEVLGVTAVRRNCT